MKYTLSLLNNHFETLRSAIDQSNGNEIAAYFFCNRSATDSEVRFLVTEVHIVADEHIQSTSSSHISISSHSYVKALSKARRENKNFFLVHSHSSGFRYFSPQDDREEKALFTTAEHAAPNGPHGSIIIVVGEANFDLIGRVWINNQTFPLDRLRIIGKRVRIFYNIDINIPEWADRQVRVFGDDAQKILSRLHVGIVGVGGTGSSIGEQLIRMGIGRITCVDPETLTDTNVTRVYGSKIIDVGLKKTDLLKKLAYKIGLCTKITSIHDTIYNQEVAKKLKDCDFIFSCTDDSYGRSILNRLSFWYYIPVIDMAVVIDSNLGTIREITGRVTILTPGNTCLDCRNRIHQGHIAAESIRYHSPNEYKKRLKEGYIPELEITDPSVIMFTTSIASRAIMEFMQLLTGFMGDDRKTSEVLERYQDTDMGKNSRIGNAGCICTDITKWGFGDQDRFLDMNW
jgi:molybdopterin/thiamine biosynthesis adenylyltransferase/proteasome lid subunit RPN8/RPN11